MHAGDGDDACCATDFLRLEVGKAAQPGDFLARGHLALEPVLVDLGIEIAELEVRNAVLNRQLLDSRDEVVHPAVAARVAGRTDDEGDAALAGSGEKELELLAREMPERDVLTE